MNTFVKLLYTYFQEPYLLLLVIPITIIFFFLIRRDFVKLKEEPEVARQKKKVRRIMYLTRPLIALLLLLALAKPYYEHEKIVEGDPFVKILVDNSTSMALFEPVADKLAKELERHLPVEVESIGSNEISDIGDGLLQRITPQESILLISDGNPTTGVQLGDVALVAARINTTVNSIQLNPIHKDTRINIIGPSKALEGVENTFTVLVDQVGTQEPKHVTITFNNELVFDEVTNKQAIEFTKKLGTGTHKITAKVESEDFFPQNNIFYKTIRVVPKPTIAFVSSSESPMQTLLKEIYSVVSSTTLPDNLKEVYAVIMNDIPADQADTYTDKLNEYVSDGNGLLVVGGKNSFDFGGYRDSLFETILPSFVSSPGKKEGGIAVVLLIDISGSTGLSYGDGSVLDVQKALAITAYQALKLDNVLAVVAFNTESYTVSEPSFVYEKPNLEDTIARLQLGGGTLIHTGIQRALRILAPLSGSKNIILISDGKTQAQGTAITATRAAAQQGVKIYTVGVGENTNEEMMTQIADITNGIYFRADDSSRLRILFGKPDERESNKLGLVVLNKNHFITENLELKGLVYGFNAVVPKTTARLLVTTTTGEPLVTVWRLGLGRVAALSTDDGTNWAGELLNKENSKILTRMTNWAIGDPNRKSKEFVDVSDTRVQERTEVIIKSSQQPNAPGATFYKTDEDVYTASITPTQTGFYEIAGTFFGVNYPAEYAALGENPELKAITASTGGKIFKPEDIEGIIQHTKSRARRAVITKDIFSWPFILGAILLLLTEIFIRRIIRREV